jgi:zinc protease
VLVAAAKKVVHPGNLVWAVADDRAKIEAGVRELNYGEIRLIDTEGNPVQ